RVKLFQAPQIESAPAFRQLKANISPAGSNFRCPPGLLFTRKIGAPCNGFRNLRVKGISQERKNLQTEKISPAKGFQIRGVIPELHSLLQQISQNRITGGKEQWADNTVRSRRGHRLNT